MITRIATPVCNFELPAVGCCWLWYDMLKYSGFAAHLEEPPSLNLGDHTIQAFLDEPSFEGAAAMWES